MTLYLTPSLASLKRFLRISVIGSNSLAVSYHLLQDVGENSPGNLIINFKNFLFILKKKGPSFLYIYSVLIARTTGCRSGETYRLGNVIGGIENNVITVISSFSLRNNVH